MRAPSRRPTEQSAHADLPGRGRVVFFQSGRPLRRAERVEIDTGESGYLHSGSCGDAGAAACPALPRLLAALMPRQRGASSALPCSITCRCIPCHLLCRWCVHLLSVPSCARRLPLRGGCLRSSSAPCSPDPGSMAASSTTTSSFSSRHAEWYAVRGVRPTLRRTRSPGAPSHPHRSAVVPARLAAVERVLASPWSPNSHPPLRRSIGLCEWRLSRRPVALAHVVERRERVASASAHMSRRAGAAAWLRSSPGALHVLEVA